MLKFELMGLAGNDIQDNSNTPNITETAVISRILEYLGSYVVWRTAGCVLKGIWIYIMSEKDMWFQP